MFKKKRNNYRWSDIPIFPKLEKEALRHQIYFVANILQRKIKIFQTEQNE